MPRETAAVSAQSVSTLQPCTMSRHFMHGTGASGDALWTGCDELWSPCNERSHSARKTPMVLQTAGTISNHYTDLYNAKAMKTRDAHSPKSASWKATNWLTLTCPAPVRILWNPIFCKSSWVWPGSLFCTGLEHALGLAALLENTTARHFKLFLTHHRKVTEIMKSVWCELKTSSFWGSITPSISVTPCQEASPFHLSSCYWTWPPPHLSQYWWTTWHDTPLLPQPPSHHVNEKHNITVSENITTICHHVGEQHDCHISEHHVSSISLTISVNSWLLHISDRLFHISVTTTTPISFHIHHHVYKKRRKKKWLPHLICHHVSEQHSHSLCCCTQKCKDVSSVSRFTWGSLWWVLTAEFLSRCWSWHVWPHWYVGHDLIFKLTAKTNQVYETRKTAKSWASRINVPVPCIQKLIFNNDNFDNMIILLF